MKCKIYTFISTLIFIFALCAIFTRASLPASVEKNGIAMPVIMYHSILKDTELTGKYIITPETLRRDIDYLYNHGYTTVSVQNILDYIDNGTPLPEKPVMLTFDDGCYNNLFYALPILEEKHAHGIFSIVGKYTDDYSKSNEVNPSYSYMRWCDIKQMIDSPYAEIACHSYDFHSNNDGRNGAGRKNGESIQNYLDLFERDIKQFKEQCHAQTGFTPIIYTFPYGKYSKESFDVLNQEGFRVTFSCSEGINYITRDISCMKLVKRYNRPGGISSEEYFYNILK